jgi:phospholipase D-like protein
VSPIVAALIPLVAVAIAFEVYCLVDLARAEEVRYLPRWAWIAVCLVSVPLGGIAYLIFGRAR